MTEATRDDKLAAARTRMAELAAKFLDRSAADIASMRSASARLAAGDAEALGDIRHLAHRMVGTGATLGYESLSERALRVEQLAESCPAGDSPDERLQAQLGEALAALETDFQRLRES